MKITTNNIDLAKEVVQIHEMNEPDKVVLCRQVKHSDMVKVFANLEPCLIGMETCGSTHFCARKLERFDYWVKLMATQFEKPYKDEQE